jgi:hypothetical protein
MTAMEGHGDRSMAQQLLEAHEVTGVSGQDERRHRVAWSRRRFAGAVSAQSLHESIDCLGEVRLPLSRGLGEGA